MTEAGRGSVVLCNMAFLRRTTDSGPVSPPTTMKIEGRDAFFLHRYRRRPIRAAQRANLSRFRLYAVQIVYRAKK